MASWHPGSMMQPSLRQSARNLLAPHLLFSIFILANSKREALYVNKWRENIQGASPRL